MNKQNVEAISPLTALQEVILQHHLLSKEQDAGRLQVCVELHGSFDFNRWQDAWQATIQQHTALRTSIHWKDLKKSVQVVHKTAPFQIDSVSKTTLSLLLQTDDEKGLSLDQAPAMRVTLSQIAPSQHLMLWTCHHILLDGWSSSLILQEVLERYNTSILKQAYSAPPTLSTQTYHNYLKEQNTQQQAQFWKDFLQLESKDLACNIKASTTKHIESEKHEFSLPATTLPALRLLAQKLSISPYSMFIGSWGLILSHLKASSTITTGLSVSGRTAPILHIEEAIGMFANVIPVSVHLKEIATLSELFVDIFKKQNALRKFEQCSLADIHQWANLTPQDTLFDNLIVYANQPWSETAETDSTQLSYRNLKGDFTSIYPLTLIIKETPEAVIEIHAHPTFFNKETIETMGALFTQLLNTFITHPHSSIEAIRDLLNFKQLSPLPKSAPQKVIRNPPRSRQQVLTHPQQDMLKIWKHTLGHSDIGIDDDFLQLGGNSFLALKLAEDIRRTLPYVLSIDDLYKAQTIRQLVQLLQSKKKENTIDVVKMREGSSDRPVFFIAGFSDGLIHHFNLQTKIKIGQRLIGLGLSKNNKALKADAILQCYLEQLTSIQPKGPYNLIGYCEGSRIAFELAKLLQEQGETVSNVFIIDSQNIPQPLNPEGGAINYILNGLKTIAYFNQTHRRFGRRLKLIDVTDWLLSRFKTQTRAPDVSEPPIKKEAQTQQEAFFTEIFYRQTNPHKQTIRLIATNPRHNLSSRLDYTMGWGKYSLGSLSVHNIDTEDHDSITLEPAVNEVAAIINQYLTD